MTVGVLLLAAGEGRRFGRDKRRAQVPSGQTVLATSIAVIRDTGLPLRVCLRPGEAQLAQQSGLQPEEVIACERARCGMGSTLAEGVAQLPAWQGVLVALADMPAIQASTFAEVAAALGEDAIVVPTWRGSSGHPVGFGSRWFGRLAGLRGDMGARTLVREAGAQRTLLAVADPGILSDVDFPSDLAGIGRSGGAQAASSKCPVV
ncbi:nucleotidyltransferase family protein [Haliea salexigens]|uniref:nucleotidyltransferase family protein n=1 Tax=Haliea salexigens TaxID=287487 RepID=UPI00040DAE84|nr:nucleotidyltransferase family protein [Haliea salexigens]